MLEMTQICREIANTCREIGNILQTGNEYVGFTVGKLFTWGADEEALDSLRFVPGVCVRLLVLLTATMSAYHGVARFGNWVFSRRMVPVASANDWHAKVCTCLCVCVCVYVYVCV